MMILLRILALIFISKIPKVACTEKAFFLRNEENYLANHVIETKQADSELECGMRCVANESCASVNYKTSGIGKGRCKLNMHKTLQDASDAETHNPEFIHLVVVKRVGEIMRLIILVRACWCGINSSGYRTKILQNILCII